MFLSWFIGTQKADELVLSKRLVSEEMIYQRPEEVSSAVQHSAIDLPYFQKLFETDAWESVLQMGTVSSFFIRYGTY